MTKPEATKILREYIAHTGPHVSLPMVKAAKAALARLRRKL